MRKWLHLVIGISFGAALFLPVFDWTFKQAQEATLTFHLKGLSYSSSPGNIVSQMDNQALFWLTIALGALHLALAFAKLTPLLLQKLYNASALLSSALIFSIVVTSYRAENSITMDVAERIPGLGAWILALAWLGSLYLYFRYRKQTIS